MAAVEIDLITPPGTPAENENGDSDSDIMEINQDEFQAAVASSADKRVGRV